MSEEYGAHYGLKHSYVLQKIQFSNSKKMLFCIIFIDHPETGGNVVFACVLACVHVWLLTK